MQKEKKKLEAIGTCNLLIIYTEGRQDIRMDNIIGRGAEGGAG